MKKRFRSVREFLDTISGFKNVSIIKAEKNKGLALSIIDGVSQIINKYGSAIVIEDDLLTSVNFLTYMNHALTFYQNDPKVFSISGFMFDIPGKKDYSYDIFFTKRHCSWGWAMWSDRWNKIDWNVADFDTFVASKSLMKSFNDIGADLTDSLIRQQKGEINSWAIRCNYHQFKQQTYTAYPVLSKVINLGFGTDATHTKQKFNKYKATLDSELKQDFSFPESVFEEPDLLKSFKKKYSRTTRLYYYLLNFLFQ